MAWKKITSDWEEGGLAVKDTHIFNKALMLKAMRDVASNKQKLWVQLVMAKYCSNRGLWRTTKVRGTSKLWKDIQMLKLHLKDSIFWQVNNGDSIPVKFQPWYPGWDKPNRKSFTHNPMLSEVFDAENDQWNLQALGQVLSVNHCSSIIQHAQKPDTTSDLKDKLIWKVSKSGNYNTKQGYTFLITMTQSNASQINSIPPDLWKQIWSIKNMQPRVKTFLWRALHDGILTSHKMHSIINQIDPTCQICGLDAETTTHTLFQCSIPRLVWFSSQFSIRSDQLSPQFTSNIQALASQMSEIEFTYFCNLLWCIWKARNSHLFKGKSQSPQQILFNANALQGIKIETSQVCRKETQDIINIPPFSRIVLVDASWDQQKRVGVANVTYDQTGKLTHFQLSYTTAESPFHAETKALLQAAKIITQNTHQADTQYILLSDCKQLIEVLQKKEEENLSCWHASRLIHELIEIQETQGERIRFQFVLRQAVSPAHLLANLAWLKQLEMEGDDANLPQTDPPLQPST
ncbi:hypothetical protein LUZ61_012076 [Rhynchospora tenuis]|uniref:Uncharacterized protein n=1 Tax=Rhynchospora tenuis TaxID=198213 RepID=A0AAD6F0U9_9POAL|nr:hypothetical protein LUZ61_012076 [Rhynchospora tenuis]